MPAPVVVVPALTVLIRVWACADEFPMVTIRKPMNKTAQEERIETLRPRKQRERFRSGNCRFRGLWEVCVATCPNNRQQCGEALRILRLRTFMDWCSFAILLVQVSDFRLMGCRFTKASNFSRRRWLVFAGRSGGFCMNCGRQSNGRFFD
jgi:hypothetical protein